MNFLFTRRAGAIVAATTVAALVLAGCSRADEGGGDGGGTESSPGITDTTVKLGISTPLSGPTAGPGACSVAGLLSYLEVGNAAGGFEFGDGKTRTVELTYLDDAFDPAKAVSNFRTLVDSDGIFAYVGSLGTPTNGAVMPIANEEEVPQVLLFTGASGFSSDQEANPWTFGMLPTYYDEGRTFGEFLVERGPTTVAILEQNDDYGEDYVRGFEDAVEGTDVEVVATATFESSDPTVDSQVTELANSGAEVLLSAASITPLQVGVLTKAQSLGWLPEIFLPSNTSTPATIVEPGSGGAYPAVYTTTFSKVPSSPGVRRRRRRHRLQRSLRRIRFVGGADVHAALRVELRRGRDPRGGFCEHGGPDAHVVHGGAEVDRGLRGTAHAARRRRRHDERRQPSPDRYHPGAVRQRGVRADPVGAGTHEEAARHGRLLVAVLPPTPLFAERVRCDASRGRRRRRCRRCRSARRCRPSRA